MRLVVTIWDILVLFFMILCIILVVGNYIYTTVRYGISAIKHRHKNKHKDNIREFKDIEK